MWENKVDNGGKSWRFGAYVGVVLSWKCANVDVLFVVGLCVATTVGMDGRCLARVGARWI